MLSATNSVLDVKAKLGNTYDYYGYASDGVFVTAITAALTQTALLDMYPHLTQSYYETIQAKDKVSLTLVETYLYEAEVAYAAWRFLRKYRSLDQSDSSGGSLSVEGYSRGSGSGASGLDRAMFSLADEARGYMGCAGYKVMQVKRGGSLLADDALTLDLGEVELR